MRIDYPKVRITAVLDALGIARSCWYYQAIPRSEQKRPGPAPKPIPNYVVQVVRQNSQSYPWYGYQKIAVICRRQGYEVKDRQAYQVMRAYDLLHNRAVRQAALYQAFKLYQLLPQGPNELVAVLLATLGAVSVCSNT
jgi:hypothetical protein